MVPILTILTFVAIIGIHMIYEYAKKRRELRVPDGIGIMDPKVMMLLQDGNERFEKKGEVQLKLT